MGSALVASSVIAVAPLAAPPALDVAPPEVQLTSFIDEIMDNPASLLNIPANLFNDIINIPYVLFSKPYSVEGLIPQFATDDQTVDQGALDALADGKDFASAGMGHYAGFDGADNAAFAGLNDDGVPEFHGALGNLGAALQYTGSWWLSSPTNVWGWDTGNPWNYTALIKLLPFPELSDSLAKNMNIVAEADFPEVQGCDFTCPNIMGMIEAMSNTPSQQQLIDGYTFDESGTTTNPINGLPEIWAGTTVQLDPDEPWNNFVESLLQDPADNPIQLPDLGDIFTSTSSFLQGFWEDFELFTLAFNPDSLLWALGASFLGFDS
jgi:transposase